MLTLPLQIEPCWKSATRQLNEGEKTAAAVWGRLERDVRPRSRASGALVTRIWNQGGHLDDQERSVSFGDKNWGLKSSPRLKRPSSSRKCKLWLSQQINGNARAASPPGLVLTPVSHATTPALEANNIALSPPGIQDEERFLNVLVTCAPLRVPLGVPKDKKDSLICDVNHGEEEERVPSNRREESRENKTEEVDRNGKQKRRLGVGGLQMSPEFQQKRVDSAPNSEHGLQLEEKILLLESVDVDTAKVFSLCPSIVNISVDRFKSVIHHLESYGLRRNDLGRILSMTPQILELSVKNHLQPAVRFLLKEVGLRRADLRKVIIRCPRLLVASVDNQLRPTMRYLEGLGFPSMASLVSNNATLLTFGVQSKLLPKLEFLQTLGMSHDEAVTMVVRFPAIFNYGVGQNLQPKYDYLVRVMGRDVGTLKAFPQYFGYSLDYRIRRRHEFSLQRNIRMSLRNLLQPSDEEFYARFRDRQPAVSATGSTVDRGWKKPEIAAVSEALDHLSISVPVSL